MNFYVDPNTRCACRPKISGRLKSLVLAPVDVSSTVPTPSTFDSQGLFQVLH